MEPTAIRIQNPWWENAKAISEDFHLKSIEGKSYYYSRPEKMQLKLEPGNIHILRGPRQVGKTTFLKELIRDILKKNGTLAANIFYLSCEEIESHTELTHHLLGWLEGKKAGRPAYLFLDEISFVSEWQRGILSLANMGLLQNVAAVLTGSNARDLKESSERLPGRRGAGRDLELYPLNCSQFHSLKAFEHLSKKEAFEIYLKVGGFPHAMRDYASHGIVTDETYHIYRNWIIGDASRYKLSEEFLKHILYRISQTQGSRVTWPTLIETTPVKSHETALEYVEHLTSAFLCRVLYPYDSERHGPSFHKARKLYYVDPLLSHLGLCWKNNVTNIFQWVTENARQPECCAPLLEACYIMGAARQFSGVYFWYSTKQKSEVDLVIAENEELRLFDIKWKKNKTYTALGKTVEILDSEELEDFLMKIVSKENFSCLRPSR